MLSGSLPGIVIPLHIGILSVHGRPLLFGERHKEGSQQKTCRGLQMHPGYQQVQGPACRQNGKVQPESGTSGKWMPFLWLGTSSSRSHIEYKSPRGSPLGFSFAFLVRVDTIRQRLRGALHRRPFFYPLLSRTGRSTSAQGPSSLPQPSL